MPRCPVCLGNLLVQERDGPRGEVIRALVCLLCGRSESDKPTGPPPRLNTHSRRSHARV